MGNYRAISLLLSGAMFAFALNLLFLFVGNRERRKDLALALMFFAMGCYDIIISRVYSSTGFSGALPWLRWVPAVDEVVASLAIWYLAEVTGLIPRRILVLAASAFGLLAVAGLLLPGALTWVASSEAGFFVRLPLLPELGFLSYSLGPLGVMGIIMAIPFLAYCFSVLRRFAMLGNLYEALSIGVAISTAALSVLSDALIHMGAYHFVPLTEYGWALALVSIAFLSSRETSATSRRFQRLAYFDPLTGLPNREMFHECLSAAIARAKRSARRMALLFIDLDRFKSVNDTLGHAAGDAVLIEIAKRIKAKVRESDTVSRLGGDEYTVILEGIARSSDAMQVASSLLGEFSRPITIGETEFCAGGSIGIAIYPYDDMSAEGLTRKADAAMYQAKQDGGNGYRFISGETDASNKARFQLETTLRLAIDRNNFILHFQPLISLATGQIVGAEALVRWQKSDGELVSPGEFIAFAEETGLIVKLGQWVLESACSEAADWCRQGFDIPVSVNFSSRQFKCADIMDLLSSALSKSGLAPGSLIVEVTESSLMENIGLARRTMIEMNELGVRIAIDDFGTGYSSLGYLASFPVKEIKIDQSFVRGSTGDPKLRSIVDAIIAMAGRLGLDTVAEGVETAEQHRYLRSCGCSIGQGFFYSQPVDSQRFLGLVAADRAKRGMGRSVEIL